MSQLWSRALEWLGRVRLGGFGVTKLRVGNPSGVDARGGDEWKQYLSAERLYDVWGPAQDGPWVPFHCVPLFAAIDRLPRQEVGPAPSGADPSGGSSRAVLPSHATPGAPAPRWLGNDVLTMLDLPGPAAVEAAAWLVRRGGCQPVCTFDNWPHPRGVLRAEHTLAELLRWASTIVEFRQGMTAASPPLWVCDSERLGTRSGKPGDFDNRYYLDDSVLPGPALLRQAGVRRIVYATLGMAEIPVLDLEPYFAELLAAGFSVEHVDLGDDTLVPHPFTSSAQRKPLIRTGYRRSAAGGFGTEVPQPSSGGSS